MAPGDPTHAKASTPSVCVRDERVSAGGRSAVVRRLVRNASLEIRELPGLHDPVLRLDEQKAHQRLKPSRPYAPIAALDDSVRPPGSPSSSQHQVESVKNRGRGPAGSNGRPRQSRDIRRARNRSGSHAATSHHMLPDGVAMNRSPTEICCHSGWMRSALRRPKLSSRSQLYQPPRSVPI